MTNARPSLERESLLVLLSAAILSFALSATGCTVDNAEFVIRDRPRITQTDAEGNESGYYLVHVGDSPTLAFRSKFNYCDYAIMQDTRDGGFEDCGPDLSGAFEWPYKFKTVTPPGEFTTLTVTAYATAGQRDQMPYNGRVMDLGLGNDPEDHPTAEAELRVRVYQSRLLIPVDMGGKEPLWHASRMFIEGKGIRKRRIRHSEDPRPGYFSVEGSGGGGRYTVVYEPEIDDIDPTGETEALLQVPDDDGHFHDFHATLRPPVADGEMNSSPPLTPGGTSMQPVNSPS